MKNNDYSTKLKIMIILYLLNTISAIIYMIGFCIFMFSSDSLTYIQIVKNYHPVWLTITIIVYLFIIVFSKINKCKRK